MRHCAFVAPLLKLDTIRLQNYRLFEELEVTLHEQLTVIHAENAGGKTALLSGLSVALGAALYYPAGNLWPGDVRQEVAERRLTRTPFYPCRVEAAGRVAHSHVKWARALTAPRRRTTNAEMKEVRAVLDHVWTSATGDWPVVAFYGTQRLWGVVKATKQKRGRTKRADGYLDALDPRSKERQLMEWLFRASIAKLQRDEAPGELIAFEKALATALSHQTDDGEFRVEAVEFDVANDEPVLRSTAGRVPWSQLSDGFHVYAGLVADLARRCVTLNPQLGDEAATAAQGVVLIDEIDLHLHPRWQRVVVPNLIAAFPSLQFVVSTHSPQVLSSVANDQVRTLRRGRLVESPPVQGRDSNSILRELFETPERDPHGKEARVLEQLRAALDRDAIDEARPLLEELRAAWGSRDPEVVRAERIVGPPTSS